MATRDRFTTCVDLTCAVIGQVVYTESYVTFWLVSKFVHTHLRVTIQHYAYSFIHFDLLATRTSEHHFGKHIRFNCTRSQFTILSLNIFDGC